VRLVDRVARGLAARFTRRSFLAQTAVVGSALVVDPKGYVLTPGTAYAHVCGPDNHAADGYTVFCCTVNGGKNSCPPGTFTAGWWKAADSSWCCGGYRYIVDCNAGCSDCTSGCSGDHICDKRCWNCSCRSGSTKTCDQRRHCCNAFRYGQCNTQVRCSGGVACRVVSCVAPYKWDNCTTTSLSDNPTAEHNAPCLQGCSAILKKYDAMGAQASPLGSSRGPERAVGDRRGRYVRYDQGSIHWTTATGARAVYGPSYVAWQRAGGSRGALGYPTADRRAAKDGKGWIQPFEKGATCDGPGTVAIAVHGAAYTKWVALGRETGVLGYPALDRVSRQDGKGWFQRFQNGAICDSTATTTTAVYGDAFLTWAALGRENGSLGYPTAERVLRADRRSWYQQFQRGAVCDSPATRPCAVRGWIYTRWAGHGRDQGHLGFPTANQKADKRRRGVGQTFSEGAQLWSLTGRPARILTGPVLKKWLADGGADGRWGFPLSDVTKLADGTERAVFEGGVLTA
jgi:uncharacterized protein with LGFP repeats